VPGDVYWRDDCSSRECVYVQIYSGGAIAGNPRVSWDATRETSRKTTPPRRCASTSRWRPLVRDLKQRGMLDDTLVLFTTEFGRTPFAQIGGRTLSAPAAITIAMDSRAGSRGAGLKPGIAIGTTDEVGWKVEEKPVAWHDFHATVLHLLGIDHEKLTFLPQWHQTAVSPMFMAPLSERFFVEAM